MKCTPDSILTLHTYNMNLTFFDLFNLLAPFVNQFSNLFTITKIANVYPHHAVTNIDLLKKSFFDILALIGIISNAIVAANKYNFTMGIIKGLLYLIFAFMIPNLFMHNILYSKYFSKYKLISGLFIIYLLEVTILTLFCVFKKIFHKDEEHEKSKEKNKNH